MTFRQRVALAAKLAWPSVVAQLSSILMQYIDAAMVGRLGADNSASVGLVSTSLWFFWGVSGAALMGFSIQVAHRVGASDYAGARSVVRQGLAATAIMGLFMATVGILISGHLPGWLGGTEAVNAKASVYFLVFMAALPFIVMCYIMSGFLRAAGNMKVPSAIGVGSCVLDVIFNFLLIFPTHHFDLFGVSLTIPGANLGVLGAALGTVGAEMVAGGIMFWYLARRQKGLALFGPLCDDPRGRARSWRGFIPRREVVRNALKISMPMTLEHAGISGGQIAVTLIVAPLGVMSIAANAFAITAESLCYMPGYGISDAATTLVGQSYGAKRMDLAKSFAWITTGMGMAVMGVMGVLMWVFAPEVMTLMSPVEAIESLGTSALRIEAWAEPMFAAAIVAYGAMVGVGDATLPAIMNTGSIWLVRLPLAALLAPTMGLNGVWLAMCLELCVRGSLFLWRLASGSWLRHGLSPSPVK